MGKDGTPRRLAERHIPPSGLIYPNQKPADATSAYAPANLLDFRKALAFAEDDSW